MPVGFTGKKRVQVSMQARLSEAFVKIGLVDGFIRADLFSNGSEKPVCCVCKVVVTVVLTGSLCGVVTTVLFAGSIGALRGGKGKKAVPKGKLNVEDDLKEVNKIQVRLDCLAGLTLFAERGFYSGHVYQPYVNHRVMDFNSFHEARPTAGGSHGTPLIDSVLRPTEMNSFSLGNKMSFYFYEVEEVETPDFPIYSPSYLSIDDGDDRFLQSCRIKKTNARTLSPETFSDTLTLFYSKRNIAKKDKTKPVCCTEIAMFIGKICSFNIGTIDGLQRLVTEHHLDWLYEVTDKPIPDQLLEFSAALRAVTRMRVAAYDGRHRFNLCCYFAMGYFDPTCRLKLERKQFDVVFQGIVAKDSQNQEVVDSNGNRVMVALENCAVFQSQAVCIATPKPGVTQLSFFEALRQQGTVTTAAQGLVVSHTAESMWSEFIEYIGSNTVLQKFTNSTYWKPKDAPRKKGPPGNDFDVIDTNTTILWDAFVKFLNASPASAHVRKNILQGNSKVDVDAMIQTFRSGTYTKGTSHCFGYKRVPKPPNGCSTIFAVFGATMKLLCDDITNFDLLRRFLQDRSFKHEQVPSCVEDKAFFGSVDYLNLFVLAIASASAETMTKRYILEKTLILWAMRQNGNPALKNDMDEAWPSFHHSMKTKQNDETMKNIVEALQDGDITDTKIGDIGVKSTKLTHKLKFAAHVSVTRDILETICEFGFNPKVTHVGEANHLLQLYLG